MGSALDSDAVEGMQDIAKIPAGFLLIRDLGYSSPKTLRILSNHNI